MMTENRPGWVEEVRAVKKMFHAMHTEDVRFIFNPPAKVDVYNCYLNDKVGYVT